MIDANGRDVHVWDVTVRYTDGTDIPVSFICTEAEIEAHTDEFMDMPEVEGVSFENFRYDLESKSYYRIEPEPEKNRTTQRLSKAEAQRLAKNGEPIIVIYYTENTNRKIAYFHGDDEEDAAEFADDYNAAMLDWATGEYWQ